MIYDHLTKHVPKTTNSRFDRKNVDELFPVANRHPFNLISIPSFVLTRLELVTYETDIAAVTKGGKYDNTKLLQQAKAYWAHYVRSFSTAEKCHNTGTALQYCGEFLIIYGPC